MDDRVQAEPNADGQVCPQCGVVESGFFCRNCGALLHGEDYVLCPRCHQIVPDGEYCNQCGQGLAGMALSLALLSAAGDSFWVTSEPDSPLASLEETELQPDDWAALSAAELPDWLPEAPSAKPPATREPRIYPSLEPVADEGAELSSSKGFPFVAVVSALLILMAIMILVILILVLLRGAG